MLNKTLGVLQVGRSGRTTLSVDDEIPMQDHSREPCVIKK